MKKQILLLMLATLLNGKFIKSKQQENKDFSATP